ncbi:MAG: PD40 domain-containing protein [Anaerolineales bacterium]|nr:PD40 domain-containing protein [Anaerolineales bacterium]
MSDANNLVVGDTNGKRDVFAYDQQTRQTVRVSVASNGSQGDEESFNPSISSDGRYVAFVSGASNLVNGDTNGSSDIFVHDRQTGQTTRVSVASDGTQGNSLSDNPTISADGRFIAFTSNARNLVSGDTTGDDVFVHDRQTGETTRVSVASDGTEGNNTSFTSFTQFISADGRYVTFCSYANNLVDGDTNGWADVFVHDRQTGQTTRVSVTSDGIQGDGNSYEASISADGRYVAFNSYASNLVTGDTNGKQDIFVHDRQTGQTTRVSVTSDGTQGDDTSESPAISSDGRYITFSSLARNLASWDTNNTYDVFIHDRQTGQTKLVSIASDGTQGNLGSVGSSVSSDGRYVTFGSYSTNLVSGDTNGYYDIFVHENTLSVILPWTIMVYLDGDNNLDPNYFNVFNQLENAADNPNVNVIVAWDRSGNNNSAYYKVQYDTNVSQLVNYVEGEDRWDQGELNMDEPTSLSDFINWARTNYPAQHYALLISNHGTGLNGTAIDDTNGGGLISVKGLGDALATATSNGSNKLDIVFADSCLMAMIEDGYQIRNYANIYIASENLLWIPGSGTRPYSSYVSGIAASTTPQGLATNILSEYASWLDDTFPGEYGYTLSAIDLNEIDPLITAVNNLSSILQSQLPTYSNQIRNARNAAQKFDSVNQGLESNFIIDNSDEYVDLSNLASELKQKISDTDIQNAAQDVTNAVNTYVIGNTSDSGSEVYPSTQLDPNHVHGVSIFFPTGDSKRSFYNGLNLDFASDAVWNPLQSSPSLSAASITGWGSFLVEYVSTINPSAPDDPNPPDLAAPLLVGESFPHTDTFVSIASQDGHIFELLENRNTGWRFNTTSARFYVGDDRRNRQYLSILSFDTSSLPDDAVILSATLNVKRVRTIGTDPFDTHGNLLVEIGSPCFGNSCKLEASDFQASAQDVAGLLSSFSVDNWHSAALGVNAFLSIDLTGTTQFRLRFELDDNNDRGMDAIQFLSGNAPVNDRPQLIIEYYVP